MRRLQYREDNRQGVGKRSRTRLADEYRRRYETEILDRTDLADVVRDLPGEGLAALLCVERDPEACHRSLIASRLADGFGLRVSHLRPAP
jgi:hypothetical protein